MKSSFIIGFAALVLAPAVAVTQETNFTGTWERNDRLSQDPFEKIEHALGMDQQGSGQGSNPLNRGEFLRDNRAALLRALIAFAEVLHTLEVEHRQGEMTVAVGDGEEFFSLFYLDGEPHARELPPDGLRIEATATLEGTDVKVEQKGADGGILREIYSLLADGRQLAVVFHLESNLSETPIFFRTVYDRAEE